MSKEFKIFTKTSLAKISELLAITPGKVSIEGFTDNIPIKSINFNSNWELSTARAIAVLTELLKNSSLDSKRFVIIGHGENNPIENNDTPENRALNRRVELIVFQGEEDTTNDQIIKIDSFDDLKNLPNMEKIDAAQAQQLMQSTFRPNLQLDQQNNTAEAGDLGLFKEDELYDYEIGNAKN